MFQLRRIGRSSQGSRPLESGLGRRASLGLAILALVAATAVSVCRARDPGLSGGADSTLSPAAGAWAVGTGPASGPEPWAKGGPPITWPDSLEAADCLDDLDDDDEDEEPFAGSLWGFDGPASPRGLAPSPPARHAPGGTAPLFLALLRFRC
jgi:hypothetical protein